MKVFILFGFLITLSCLSFAQETKTDSVTITFEVMVPESTPDDATIFWAGSLNNWDPGDKGIGFGAKEYAKPAVYRNNQWSITLAAPKGSNHSYKYTRGSMYSAEEQLDFTYRPVRTVVFDESKTVRDTVATWHDIPPSEIAPTWPKVDLEKTHITIAYNDFVMNGTGTLLNDKKKRALFYDFPDNHSEAQHTLGDVRDIVYYYEKVSATTNDLQLIAAAQTGSDTLWSVYVNMNGDNTITPSEKKFIITQKDSSYKWSGQIPVRNIINGKERRDSVRFSVANAVNLPEGYASSSNPNAPSLIYNLPFKHRTGSVHGYSFNITTDFSKTFKTYPQLTIDRNENDTLNIGSGSNEIYVNDLNKMRMNNRFYEYPSFKLGDQFWQIANIDLHGNWVRLRPARNIENTHEIAKGKNVPSWQAITIKNKGIGSEELKGNYVLLDFWGSWCGPCIQQLPRLKEVYRRFKNKNFEIVGFAFESEESLRAAIKKYDLPWPQVLDDKGTYGSKFIVRGYPSYFLVDPNGILLETGGALHGDDLIPTLEKYLE